MYIRIFKTLNVYDAFNKHLIRYLDYFCKTSVNIHVFVDKAAILKS